MGAGRIFVLLSIPGCGPAARIPQPEVTPATFDPSAPVRESDPPPPPISGGSLLAARDGRTFVFADPDRDVVWRADMVAARLLQQVALDPGDEPGRVVEDAAGRFHAVLRGGGALATIRFGEDLDVVRRSVCAEPRGVAYDPAGDVVHVVCTGGDLVTLRAAGGDPIRRVRLDKDLRDVVVDGDRLLISTFRSAEVLVVDRGGKVERRISLPSGDAPSRPDLGFFEPSVAWRMIPKPGGGAYVIHQRAATRELPKDTPAGTRYYADVVQTVVTEIDRRGEPRSSAPEAGATLPVDLASCDGRFAIAAAAEPALLVGDLGSLGFVTVAGQIVAVACGPDGEFVAASREPAALFSTGGPTVLLPAAPCEHTGHGMFHLATDAGIACASCHPEGREDGRVWLFEGDGPRRTQPVYGGVLGTAPFHWDGSLPRFEDLVGLVLVGRMGAPRPPEAIVDSMARWLDSVPAPRGDGGDPSTAARGRIVYERAGCAGCHEGGTDRSFDVGTGGLFQAPPLAGLGTRAPYLHDGTAETLEERFESGDDRHGHTEDLAPVEIAALVSLLGGL